jgi:hypothetical protein
MGFECVACNHLNQKKIQCWALVDMVTQLWFPSKSGNFSTSRVTIASQGLCSMQLDKKIVFKMISKFFAIQWCVGQCFHLIYG